MLELADPAQKPRCRPIRDPLGTLDLLAHLAALARKAQEVFSAHGSIIAVKAIPDVIQRPHFQREHLPVALHLQPQPLLQILGNRFPRTVQFLFVRAKEDNIVHVSHAVLHTVERRDVTVERFQIEVCKPLADEKANGQPLFAGLQDLPRQL